MENNVLFQKKYAALSDALNHKEGAYVPTLMCAGNGTIAWAGKKATEVLDDPQAYLSALTDVFAQMWVDGNMFSGAIIGNKMERGLKTIENKYGPDGNTLEHVQLSPMGKDEYPLLIENPGRYVSEVMLPRKYPHLFESREATKTALKLFVEDRNYVLLQLSFMADQLMKEKYGIVPTMLNPQERIEPPLDMIFDYFRGFRGTLTDLRRQPENVKAAMESLWAYRNEARHNTPYVHQDMKFPYHMAHIPSYLSPKQFEELFWPYHKKMIERVAAGGGKAYILMEGRWEKIWHHFLELPKDSCILAVDDDDIFKASAELGHHQIICGGLKLADTRLKTFDKIQDDVKRVIDTCAPGGGFIFCTDKAWIAPGDVNQSLIDAYNFAHEYSSK